MKKYKWIAFTVTLLLSIIVSLFYFNLKIAGETVKVQEVQADPIEVVEPIIPQVLLDIAWCESNMSQDKKGYNYRYKIVDGQKIKYLWSTDIGYWQINDYYHLEDSKKLGIDIYTYEGNRDYALLLYNKNGVKDWGASSACWSDIVAWKAKHKQPYYQ
jgi:hypothetical protein